MSEGSETRRDDVVMVRFDPAERHEMQKSRPAIVVQIDGGNENASTTIVAPVTEPYRGYPLEVLVETPESPLEKDFSIRLYQICVVSIEKRIHSVVWSLDAITVSAVDEALKVSFGLD